MKIVCYGDSNTYGWDPRYFSGNRYLKPWPELMAEKTGHEVINCGEPGRVIPCRERELEWFRRDVTENKPDLLVIMLGTNDLFYSAESSAEAIANRMGNMVRYAIRNHLAENYLLLSCPQTAGPEKGLLPVLEALSAKYKDIAKTEQTAFADSFRWRIPLAFDGIHFTEEGHCLFADNISEIVSL